MTMHEHSPRAVTSGPLYHWFGYYGMPCWDRTGRYLLSLGVDFEDRPPTANDVAVIGMTDLHTGDYTALVDTRAFNWQQGCMLYWLPSDPERSIIYNDRLEGRFVSVVRDVFTGQHKVLGRAISDVGLGGRWGVGLNFSCLATRRPGYGYVGLPDEHAHELHPADDGLFAIDLASGEEHLAVSMHRIYECLGEPDYLRDAKLWVNHTLLNPSETRCAFLVRWRPQGQSAWQTHMFTAGPDGSDLRLVLGDRMVSHYDWRNDEEILAWTRIGGHGDHFYLINERTGAWRIIGLDSLTQDGHCCYSHKGDCFVTDTYPERDTHLRTLKLFVPDEGRTAVIGRYASPPPFEGEIRCDLHPRWSWDDSQPCIDSVHEGHRQVYLVDVPHG